MSDDNELQLHQESHKEEDLHYGETSIQNEEPELSDKYVGVLKQVLPHLGQDENKIIFAQVMLALKLEGIIGKDLSAQDSDMVNTIKEAIMQSDEKKESALMVAERIMRHK